MFKASVRLMVLGRIRNLLRLLAPSEGTEAADLDESFSRNLISGGLESGRLKIGY